MMPGGRSRVPNPSGTAPHAPRRRAWLKPLPQVSSLEGAQRQQVQEQNVIRSLAFAHERFGL
jgi:hypothetical protein